MEDKHIREVYDEVKARYDRISAATIRDILNGTVKVPSLKGRFRLDPDTPPELSEAKEAFLKYDCAIFTAFRGGYTLEENLYRNRQLKEDMESEGLRFRPVRGCYREADWEYPCIEYCYFVFTDDSADNYSFFEKVYRLSAKYSQDSFLYKRAGINRAAFLVATTDAGRRDLRGNCKFAGQLYLDVPDVEAWTDCSDGRFAFQLKGMLLIPTRNKQIMLGEGNIFDTDSYQADGIAVLMNRSEQQMADACKRYEGKAHIVTHLFTRNNYTPEYIHDVIFRCLKELRDKKCKRIGIHCAVPCGSTLEGAAPAYSAISQWAARYAKKFKTLILVDTYGDYNKLLHKKCPRHV